MGKEITLTPEELAGAKPAAGFELSPADLEGAKPVTTNPIISGVRGALQGITMGYGDELAAGIEHILGIRNYTKARDDFRGRNATARADNPTTYGAGEIAGSVATAALPGLNVAKGAGTAVRIGKSAALGTLGGVGYSDAQDAGGIAQDAAGGFAGGLLGGVAVEGAGRVLRGAPKRVENRIVQDVTEGAKQTAKDQLVGAAGKDRPNVIKVIKEFGIDKAGRDAGKLDQAVNGALDTVGAGIGDGFDQLDKVALGVRGSDMVAALKTLQRDYSSNAAKKPLAKLVGNLIDDVTETYGSGPRDRVPMRRVREFVTELQKQGFSGAVLDPAASKALRREAAAAVKGVLDQRFEEVASLAKNIAGHESLAASPALQEFAKAADAVERIRSLNPKYAVLSRLSDIAEQRTTKEASVVPHRLGFLADTAIALTDPKSFLAKKFLLDTGLASGALRAVDARLAKAVEAAGKGVRGEQLKLLAAQLGVATPVADALDAWATEKLGAPVSATGR